MSTYGQKKKRQAIRQLQQSSKRAAHANPFSSGLKSPASAGLPNENLENTFTYKISETDDDEKFSSKKPTNDNADVSSSTKISTLFGDNVSVNPFLSKPSDPRLEAKSTSSKGASFMLSGIGTASSTTAIANPVFERRLSIGRRNPEYKADNQKEAAAMVVSSVTELAVSHANARKIGTCPFMCSVSEFSERSSQGIYSIFETINSLFVHELAVKEYKRASADQEESKSEDLRPSNVLLKTVQYLCLDLVDNYADDFEELYCFIWNRTRAIRKDITQQRLSDIHTVNVLETICRFHIYSAYVLSGSSNFEAKINNENLEKCLTSLGHLYTDLRNSNQLCENEAEFRCYYALLNLNSGHIMHVMSHMPHDILNSEIVQYAISCCRAYSTNNFIRFFRLFHSGSFLSSSILYRYLNHVRQRAFVAIINSHTTTATSEVEYPISKLARLLNFVTIEDVEAFVTGMSVAINGDAALLVKRAYEVNNNSVTGRITWLDAKMTNTPGKTLFTASATDIFPPTTSLPSFGVQPLSQYSEIQTQINSDVMNSPFLTEACEGIVRSIIAQVTLEEVSSIASEVCDLVEICNSCVVPIASKIIEELCEAFVREEVLRIKNERKQKVNLHSVELFKNVYTDIFEIELYSVVREFIIEESVSHFVDHVQEDVTETVVRCGLLTIVNQEIQHFSKRDVMLSDLCSVIYEEVFQDVARKELTLYSREICANLIRTKKLSLKAKLNTQIIQKRFYFKIWSTRYNVSYAKRHTLDNVPVRLFPSSPQTVLASLLGHKNVDKDNPSLFLISDLACIDLSSPTKTQENKLHLQKMLKLRMNLLEEVENGLVGIPLKCLASASSPMMNIAIALEDTSTQLSNFILDCFSVPRTPDARSDKLESQIFRVSDKGGNINIQVINLALCSIKDVRQLSLGSTFIVIYCTQLYKEHLQDVFTDVIIISPYQKIFADCCLHITEPLNSRNIDYCNFYKALDKQVHSILSASSSLLQPEIKVVDVKDFIQSTISSKYSDLLLANQLMIDSERHLSVDPQPLIQSYNTLVSTLSEVLSTHDLLCVNWPSVFDDCKGVEMSWNTRDKLNQLLKDISDLKLPQFHGDCYSVDDCFKYCQKLNVFSSPFLLSKINTILSYKGLQWPIILNLCIHHIIENTPIISSYSVILVDHLSEIQAVNLQSFFKGAIIKDEIECELLDYDEESVHIDEDDMLEMWKTISHYEAEINVRRNGPRNISRDSTLDSTLQEVETFEHDLESFRTSVTSTEQMLQDIVNEGALPSYLMQTSLVEDALNYNW